MSVEQKLESCSNCLRPIGRLEQAHLFRDNIVCDKCNQSLRSSVVPPTASKNQASSGYSESSLIGGEKILHRAQVSMAAMVPAIVVGILTIPVLGAGLVILLWVLIICKCTEITVTNRRVIAKTGFINKQTIELNVSKVESIRIEQGLLGRMCGFGSVVVVGTGGTNDPILYIADPFALRRALSEAQHN